jgi:non-specific serine/threonine protein kinase
VLDGLRDPRGAGDADPGVLLKTTLRPYQRDGVRWLWWLYSLGLGGCLADDMGLGKTVQVLSLLLLAKRRNEPKPNLLVVPASLVANWQSEAARFAPSLRLVVAHASAMPAQKLASLDTATIADADLVITTYGSLTRLAWLATTQWNLVVLDEAQAIKNPGAKQTRAVKALRARRRLSLTGTPVENRLGDLWSQFDFVAPGLLGNEKAFTRFAKKLNDGDRGYAPLRNLVGPYILRRLKTDKRVISDLPDKTEVNAYCTLSKRQAALYAESVASLTRQLDDAEGIERRGVVLASLVRLKQICNHPAHALGEAKWAREESGKLARLAELCESIASRQEKVLVFTQFQEATAPLEAFLAEVFGRRGLVLHGGTAVKKRKELVDAFQREDGPPFFVLSLKAGGTGLNLTAASHVIHFDRWWNPAVENQATDRAFRIGQKRNVLVHKFVCRGTVEERIDQLIESKKQLTRDVLEGGAELLLTEMTDKELLDLVRLDIRVAQES